MNACSHKDHRRLFFPIFALFLWACINPAYAYAAQPYDIGTPTVAEIWVDPVDGNDNNSGSDRQHALLTVAEAWDRVPRDVTLSVNGYRLMLISGDYPESALPGYMEARTGTYQFPVIIQAADGPHTVRLHGYLNIYDCHYLYLINLDFITDRNYGGGGNVVHVASSDNILIRGCTIDGFDGVERQPQESLKVNQGRYIYVEDNSISGAFWFPLDFVAVQYGHIVNNRIHDSGDDCFILKGGTSYFRIEGNEIYNCGVTGFSAGQGTGFEFMVSPWLHYEAYDLKFVNNIVHDVVNAGMAVRGGYNIVLAYNTLYRIGSDERGSGLLLLSPGGRGCDGDSAACALRNAEGGWGPTTVGDGAEWIPNRNVYVYNNIFYNPAGVQTLDSHFTIFGPVFPPPDTNIPSPSLSDDNVRIRGNIIWNGSLALPLGIEDPSQGCQPSNPACNATQLMADNAINTIEPQIGVPPAGDFHPSLNSNIFNSQTYAIPAFSGHDRPQTPLSPQGDLSNIITVDRDGRARILSGPPGAYAYSSNIFSDVPVGYWAENYIYSIYNVGITSGCGGGNYCPESLVTRGQMAVFVVKALDQQPVATCTGTVFNDVNANMNGGAVFCRYIEKFRELNITVGCAVDNPNTPQNEAAYCPENAVTRGQMAVFLTKALGEQPAATCTGTVFNDVNAGMHGGTPFCRYIEKFRELNITAGCAANNPNTPQNEAAYCPDNDVTRAQMAVFLTKGFLQ